jgi:hypothetical protein
MSGDGNTKHKITFENTGDTDLEFLMFRFFKLVPNARAYFDENGKSTGNGYDWPNIIEDMAPLTLAYPDILVTVYEKGTYGGEEFENRYYFQNGKSAWIEPVVTKTWPEFTPDLLI